MTSPTYIERRTNCRRLTIAFVPNVTAADFLTLAQKYEGTYRRHRASKRPPTRSLLMGQLLTARAFYSLAREGK